MPFLSSQLPGYIIKGQMQNCKYLFKTYEIIRDQIDFEGGQILANNDYIWLPKSLW